MCVCVQRDIESVCRERKRDRRGFSETRRERETTQHKNTLYLSTYTLFISLFLSVHSLYLSLHTDSLSISFSIHTHTLFFSTHKHSISLHTLSLYTHSLLLFTYTLSLSLHTHFLSLFLSTHIISLSFFLSTQQTRYNGRSPPILGWPEVLISFSVTLSHYVPIHYASFREISL